MAGGGARRGALVHHYGTGQQRPQLDRGGPETLDSSAIEGSCGSQPADQRSYGAGGEDKARSSLTEPTERPMPQANDLSRCLVTLEQDDTLIAVIKLSQASWLVAGIVPAIERQPVKKIEADEVALLRLLERWRDEATRAGRRITRVCVAFEAGRDGFWLARWLRARGSEAYDIHPSSGARSREHRRAQTDRLDA